MPTSLSIFFLHSNTLARLFDYSMDGPAAVHCTNCLAQRMAWVTATAMHAMQRQPIALGYVAKRGVKRLAQVMREAEMYFFAGQLRRALMAAGESRCHQHEGHESQDAYLDRMLELEKPDAGEPVFH
jgi:hypothetical protein